MPEEIAAEPRTAGGIPQEHRVQARQALEEQSARIHVVRAGAARAGRHQPRRGRTGLPLPQAPREPLLAQQPGLDAQPPLAVQHGHQRRHAGRDHQDAGGLRPRQNPAPARAARGLAVGPDRRRAVPRRDRDPEPAVGREPDRGHAEFGQVADRRPGTALRDLSTLHHRRCREGGPADRANQRTVALPSGQSVALVIKLK